MAAVDLPPPARWRRPGTGPASGRSSDRHWPRLLAPGLRRRAGLLRGGVRGRAAPAPSGAGRVRRRPDAPCRRAVNVLIVAGHGDRQAGAAGAGGLRATCPEPQVGAVVRRLLQQRRPLLGLLLRDQRRGPVHPGGRLRARLPARARRRCWTAWRWCWLRRGTVTPEEIMAEAAAGLPPGRRGGCPRPACCGRGTAGKCHGDRASPRSGWRRWLSPGTSLDCDFFDWLSAVDELDAGLAVVAHVYSLAGRHHVLLRSAAGADFPRLPTATGIYRGAAWHERETHEMFGVVFDGPSAAGAAAAAGRVRGAPVAQGLRARGPGGEGVAGGQGAR